MNPRIKVAHYASRYLPLTENWIYKILINHQAYVPIFFTRKKSNLGSFPFRELYSLDDFGKLRATLQIIFSWLFGYFPFIKNICIKNEVKILHVHFGNNGFKFLALKDNLNVPMICSFYGDDAFVFPRKKKSLRKYRRLFRKVDRIIVLGPYMKSELMRLGCSESKIRVHHLGIDVQSIKFSKRPSATGRPIRFLIASSFVAKKGINLSITALAKFKNTCDYTLDIIGDGPLKEEVLSTIKGSGIKSRTTMHGYKPYSFFVEMAGECDVLLHASRTAENNSKEGTPMAIVDAMATGLCVISTRHSDIPEIVIDGENGFLAEENSIDSLEACILKVLRNFDTINTFGAKGRKWVEKEFDAKTQTLKLEEHYSELIREHKKKVS